MARDYKNRAQPKKKPTQKTGIAWWRWLLIVGLISIFTGLLMFLQNSSSNKSPGQIAQSQPKKKTAQTTRPKHQDKTVEQPHFDFYTILPKSEIVVPDYEIKTREREERVGKAKARKYIIQAGSFKDYSEADKLRARLALMGFESKVEKARIGNATWNRVKMGPFNQSSIVSSIKTRLRKSGIDVIVTEQDG